MNYLQRRYGHEQEMAEILKGARDRIKGFRDQLSLIEAMLMACPDGTEEDTDGREWLGVAMAMCEGRPSVHGELSIMELMATDIANDFFCVMDNIHNRWPDVQAVNLMDAAAKLNQQADRSQAKAA